ncbi:MAG: hypothetical protein COA33_003955 [Fluviicola sp.]|nr:hypothetical protein [Fluviicola sp.]
MNKIIKRLKYYGIGFGFGLIFVVFFFQNRGCSWLPGNRVKNSILDRVLVVSEATSQKMVTANISNEQLVEVLNDGDILYSESDTKAESKFYLIEKDGKKYAFTLPQESFISEVFIDVKSKKLKTTSEGYGHFIHFPLDSTLIYVDTGAVVTCQQGMLNLFNTKDILKLVKESGRINFGDSDLEQKPKAEHTVEFKQGSLDISTKMIWYKNKLNITSFEFEGSDDCLKK